METGLLGSPGPGKLRSTADAGEAGEPGDLELVRAGITGARGYFGDRGGVERMYGFVFSHSWAATPMREAAAFSRKTQILDSDVSMPARLPRRYGNSGWGGGHTYSSSLSPGNTVSSFLKSKGADCGMVSEHILEL